MPENFYPPVNFYFNVIIEGYNQDINFQEVSGISVNVELESVREGGVNEYIHQLPKGTKYTNLVLKRGLVTSSSLLMNWIRDAVERFTFAPKQVIVNLLDESGNVQYSWVFNNAYPVSVKVTDLNAQDGKAFIETLELAYSFFTRG